ncbi:MAG: hypothetical protein WBV94_03340 [Blastocatellia bacterium]
MSETTKLIFTARPVTSDWLEIEVKNGTAPLVNPLMVEVTLPMQLVTKDIQNAARLARQKDNNMASLAGVVTVPSGWSVWAFREQKDHIAVIRAFNNLDQQTGKKMDKPIQVDANDAFSLRFPLTEQAKRTHVTIPYGYQYGQRAKRVDGEFELKPTDEMKDWTPTVKLFTDQQNPTMIPPGTKMKIEWEIKDGVRATLRGPLPGGNAELALSTDRLSPYQLNKGEFTIYAVGAAAYILDAEVKGPDGQPNVQVIKTLQLDIDSAQNYSYLAVRPNYTLPSGYVDIDWTVWGIEEAIIRVGTRKELSLRLTEQNLSRHYQGSGTVRVRARGLKRDENVKTPIKVTKTENVNLAIVLGDNETSWKDAQIKVNPWNSLGNPAFSGKPVGLAYAAEHLALLTGKGLWIADVGEDDYQDDEKVKFNQITTSEPKAWLALAALGDHFVALRQTADDGLQLVRYDAAGKQQKSPVDLPGSVKALVGRAGTVFDLAALLNNRVYVVLETPVPGGSVRRAWSVRFDPKDESRRERVLETLPSHRLVTFDGSLYALNRNSGQMLRFSLTEKGELEPPGKAASAIEKSKSLIEQGLFVMVGSILAVLNPTAVPSVKLETEGLRSKPMAEATNEDLIYNPQKDQWAACGHGLDIQEGAVVTFRGGGSKRLWVLQPDGAMYTLTGASEDLFARDYVRKSQFNDKFPTANLPPVINARRKFEIELPDMTVGPVDETCMLAGLDNFSASGPADLTLENEQFGVRVRNTFEVAYNKNDPSPIKLRFMGISAPATGPHYLLELTLSGPNLSSVTSVFKRLKVDERGGISIVEIPGSSAQHSPEKLIKVETPKSISLGVRLTLLNMSPYDLNMASPTTPITEWGGKWVGYHTPALSVSVPNLGELQFEFDFAMPAGIEVSSGNVAQQRQIRINTDKSIGLAVLLTRVLNPRDPLLTVEHRGGEMDVHSDPRYPVYVCQIGFKVRKVLDAIYIGDGAAHRDDKSFYLPVALRRDVSQAQVWKVDEKTLVVTAGPTLPGKTPFYLPNSVAVSSNKVFAMFGDTDLHQLNTSLQVEKKTSFEDRNSITTTVAQLKATASGDVFMMIMRMDRNTQGDDRYLQYHYFLRVEYANGKNKEIPLDSVPGTQGGRFDVNPAWVTAYEDFQHPMAVSPNGDKVAIGIEGGFILTDVSSGRSEVVRLDGTMRAEDVVFAYDGYYVYFAHTASEGDGVLVYRIRVSNLRDTDAVLIDPGEGSVNLSRGRTPEALFKYPRAISLAVEPGVSRVFVSYGRTIRQILSGVTMEVLPWQETVELPCRLFQAKLGPGYQRQNQQRPTRLIYAVGAKYVSNEENVETSETHLYVLVSLL